MRAIDPVCGMNIAWEEATDFEPAGDSVLYFCCPGCAARYREPSSSRAAAAPHWTRLTGACRESARMWSGFRGVGIPRDTLPKLGRHTIDEFEAIVVQQWRETLGYAAGRRCVCRTLERATLQLGLADPDAVERHRIEVLIAAEAARLRADSLAYNRAVAELEALPAVLETTVARAGAGPARSGRLIGLVREQVPAILAAMRGQAIQWARSERGG